MKSTAPRKKLHHDLDQGSCIALVNVLHVLHMEHCSLQARNMNVKRIRKEINIYKTLKCGAGEEKKKLYQLNVLRKVGEEDQSCQIFVLGKLTG